MQLFVNMDGVLAVFDAHHEVVFGVRACKNADHAQWNAVRSVRDFYLNIPPWHGPHSGGGDRDVCAALSAL